MFNAPIHVTEVFAPEIQYDDGFEAMPSYIAG